MDSWAAYMGSPHLLDLPQAANRWLKTDNQAPTE